MVQLSENIPSTSQSKAPHCNSPCVQMSSSGIDCLCSSKYVCCTCELNGVGDTPVTRNKVKCTGTWPSLVGVIIRKEPRGIPPTASLYGSLVMIRAVS